MKNRLVVEVEGLFAKALELIRTKNADYAGDVDPYANFRIFGWKGIIVRISDKFQRVVNFAKEGKEFAVTDESFEDTMIDMANYCMLAIAMRREETQAAQPELPLNNLSKIKLPKYKAYARLPTVEDKLAEKGVGPLPNKIAPDPKQYSTYEIECAVNRLIDELDRRR